MHAARPLRHIGWPMKLAADKGYSHPWIREFLGRCGIEPVIPPKSNQSLLPKTAFDKQAYRRRARVEHAVGHLKECRRLGTRYDKLGLSFLAFLKLAIMLKYLRILDPSDTP
jgi:transposase